MKVLVIGASGKSGRLVVERALAAGHDVMALVHGEDDAKHPLPDAVRVMHGDVQNPAKLEAAMEGCEAVIDAMGGSTPYKSTTLEQDAMKVILATMDKVGAKRLVVISVLGVFDSKEQAGLLERLMFPTFLRGALPDKEAMEQEVTRSHVEWVIVRPPILTDGEPRGDVRIFAEGETAHTVTRADLAQWMVDQLTGDQFVGKAVVVANK